LIDPANPDFESTPAAGDRAGFGYAPAHGGAAPSLTIATPFYDTAPAVFEETVRSVQRQSLQQWEWLIVDDGSTRADSIALLAALANADPRIRILRHPENRGLPAARNTAVANARTGFVLQLDSDDLLEPTAAEKWLWFLASYPEYAFVKGYEVGFGDHEYLWRRGFHESEAFLSRNLVAPTSMIRREVYDAVGGHDEELTGGLEDWEFWLRCASAGLWGATVREYLDWYRRKGDDSQRWANWDGKGRQRELKRAWRKRYPNLTRRAFPRMEPVPTPESEVELDTLPFDNVLAKSARRLLLIVPYATVGGADKFNIDLVGQLARLGWETTVVTTLAGDHSWLPRLARLTPDVFALSHFLKPADYPRFLRYVIRSRQIDAVLVSHSLLAYRALPYLRRAAPGIPIVDYCHIEEEHWLDGGYPRLSVDAGGLLDLRLTSSDHLKRWMVARGAEPDRIEPCFIGVDLESGAPRPARAELGLPEDVPILVYPVRICEQKQPKVFARTLRELHAGGSRFLALVIGDGDYLPWLRRHLWWRGLGRSVRFLGRLPNARVRELIAASDCVFIPSAHEGIAAVFYEAMAEGVPVVGADVGGQRELVTPDCGVLLERGGDEASRYAEVLTALLADPDRRRRMGHAGKARIREGFTLDRMGDRMDALLERSRELARSEPGPAPTAEQAREAALAGIRLAARAPSGPVLYVGGALGWHARMLVLRGVAAAGGPLYRLSLRLGFHWVESVKRGLERVLLPKDV
jgi:glycosyltransferase involved in cell wall biosynthesis